MKVWYPVYSKQKQEGVAQENLQRQGYECYLPLVPTRRRRRGYTTTVIAPMFPRYLFINLSDQTDDWRPILSTIGIANLVKFAQLPARVPNNLITALKQREDEEGIQVLPKTELKEGDTIQIVEGPFEGYEAIYQASASQDRVVLLLNIVERHVKLQMEEKLVEPIK